MVKVSINRYLQRRIESTRKEMETQTKKIRDRSIRNLKEILNMAARMARGESKHQRIEGRLTRVTPKQRRRWLRVAEQAAETISNVAANINEEEIFAQLGELDRLINQVSPSDKA